jgi:ATP-dependent helicase HrpA
MLPDWVRLGSRLVRLLRDRYHPARHEAVLSRLLEQARASVALREDRRLHTPRVSYPPELPITSRKDDIVAAIRANQVVVIAGETGSGKTTQIPKMCLEAGLGVEATIGCTQPRRVAALSISRRIAEELNVDWGREVGCKIRFDDRSSQDTQIKLMTDGILLAETQGDPLLCDYNALIIDEAHERSLNIDFLLGYLKGLLVKRPELKLIITSATIDTQAFSRAFSNAPIIEVSGRTYPVEVVYAPFDSESEERGDLTYIDAAVRATEQILCEPGDGDALIFMPSERDIRETSDLIESRFHHDAEVIPLFGRLSSGDQQRVFSPCAKRKIVVATNIAETSLTIPGIRYVIDSGLARVSRYNARTRTRRLPIEPVSQSSANQRKGRSGRVRNGVCIRLYSEEDFAERPPYTQPEIQRANLAEVILRMKAFRLGEIETFPFLNPPAPAAIDGGYKLLQELGALDSQRELTDLGRDLARLPIDPTLGRMLLQAQTEGRQRELLIIASALSIQDPRERPLDQKDAANAAHKRFVDPQSDFLTLLNIWNAVHEQWEKLRNQNQRRKFCKSNFLSYLRMREWQDLYAQLEDALEDLKERPTSPLARAAKTSPAPSASSPVEEKAGERKQPLFSPAYTAIHRSILAGLLGHVAHREERNLYKAPGNRQVNVFPGSVLFERGEKSRPPASRNKAPAPKPAPSNQPAWAMAGEIVETSQLFIRTLAGIDPLWIVDLAPHLCKTTHHNPHWNAATGRVVAEAKTTFYGLEVQSRRVAYGNVAPKEATEIFIRAALVEEELAPAAPEDEWDDVHLRQSKQKSHATGNRAGRVEMRVLRAEPRAVQTPLDKVLEHNRQVRQKIENWQTRVRRHDLGNLDDALFAFYAAKLENISSKDELNRWLAEHPTPEVLHLTESDLIADANLHYDSTAFPDKVEINGLSVPLSYAYSPGEDQDGVTIKLSVHQAQNLPPASLEWAVPGLREGLVSELLRSLPKSIRRELMPFPPKVAEITRELVPDGPSLKHALAVFIRRRYGIDIPPDAWPADAIPAHLQARVEVAGPDQKPLAAGRDVLELRRKFEQAKAAPPTGEAPEWIRAAKQWERFGLTSWSFNDLPEKIQINVPGRDPLTAWPGLHWEESSLNVRLFHTQDSAHRSSLPAIQRLVELALQRDLGWLQKDLRAMARFAPLLVSGESLDDLQAAAFENLRKHLVPNAPFPALTKAAFESAVAQARQQIPGLAQQIQDRLGLILTLRQEFLRRWSPKPAPQPNKGLKSLSDLRFSPLASVKAPVAPVPQASPLMQELQVLLPARFAETIPFDRLPHIPRYLKALITRAERAALNPVKDQERARQLAPYREALARLRQTPPHSVTGRDLVTEFRWMLEEFKVSLFAQELGTAVPISPKRLDQQLEKIRNTV